MVTKLKVGRESLRLLVTNDLKLSSYKRQKVHYLNKSIRKKRVIRCRALKRRHAPLHGENVLFSNEKIFTIEQATNVQNDRILATSSSAIPEHLKFVERNYHPLSVMVWAGISKNAHTKLIFIPEGVRITAKVYRKLVLEPVLKKCSSKLFKNEPWTFQQDGAPAHTANATQKWLRHEIPDFVSKLEWPPSSPDLNPMDFCVWGILEKDACAKSYTSLRSLKAALRRAWSKIPQDVFRAAIDSIPKRLNKIIVAKGGYIE